MAKCLTVILGILFFPWISWADQTSIYCPQNQGYINVGMSEAQVIAACGQPLKKEQPNQPIMQKVPVQQLIFNQKGASHAFYGVWSVPGAFGSMATAQPLNGTSSAGTTVQFNIVDNKVSSIQMNGSNNNAVSVCGSTSVQVGDPVSNVYSACGSPSLINVTYINQPIPSTTKPEIWTYQPGQYQPKVSLTFIDGKLQSIQ